MPRPSWDETWMAVALTIAERSRCDGAKVGAVIVDPNNRICSTGYNGPPAATLLLGQCSNWCPRMITGERTKDYGNCLSIHAEANAIAFADRRTYEGGTIYVTGTICWDCGKIVANSGIARAVVGTSSDGAWRNFAKTRELLIKSGVDVVDHFSS